MNEDQQLEAVKARCNADVKAAELRYAVPARQATLRTMWNTATVFTMVLFSGLALKVVPEKLHTMVLSVAAVMIGLNVVAMIVREILVSLDRTGVPK